MFVVIEIYMWVSIYTITNHIFFIQLTTGSMESAGIDWIFSHFFGCSGTPFDGSCGGWIAPICPKCNGIWICGWGSAGCGGAGGAWT